MKKIFIGLFALISAFMFSNSKVEASEYNGTLGYQYLSNGTRFYYYTDRDDVNVFVEIDNESGIFTQQLDKTPGSEGYQGFVSSTNVSIGDTYRMKLCDSSDETSCEYVLDAFSYHLNTTGDKNVILDTSEVDGKWGNVTMISTSDYKRSIYALDAQGFTKNIDTPAEGDKDSYSVFDKMVLASKKSEYNVGINYLRSLEIGRAHV